MAYATEKKRVGRKPFNIAVLKLDYCTLDYGVSPCDAGRVGSGAAQGGTASSITLSASASSTDDAYVNYAVAVTGGTAVGQTLRITAYDGTTKIATVSGTFSPVPVSGDTYNLINRPEACYNTRGTCQSPNNYNPSTTENNYWLTTETQDFPKSILNETGVGVVIPCLRDLTLAPSRISLGSGIGYRASVELKLRDFTHHDRGTDKYALSRSYTPENQGTFWGKFLARNKYYQNREVDIYTGYLDTNNDFDSANFQVRTYVIEKIDGPTKDSVNIIAKDVLKLAEDKRAKIPEPVNGSLDEAINSSQTGTITAKGIDTTKYGSSGYVRIGGEIVAYSAIGASYITISARAQWGTDADQHAIDDTLQYCIAYSNTNVVTIIQDLLDSAKQSTAGYGNNAGIATSYLDIATWQEEQAAWLINNDLTNIISEPTGVNELLDTLLEENLLYIWWDEINKLVKLKAIKPNSSVGSLTDEANFIENSISVKDDGAQRLNEVMVWYGRDNFTEIDKTSNYRNLYVQADLLSASEDQYNDSRTKVIKSDWITSGALAVQIASRLIALLVDAPKIIKFRLDAKDSINTGDFYTMDSRHIQDVDGSNLETDVIILESKEVVPGTTWEYLAQQYIFVGFYGAIGYCRKGLAQASTSNTITLESDVSTEEGIYVDGIIDIVAGTGSPDTQTVTDYNAAARRITIAGSWSLDGTSEYHVHLPDYGGDRLAKEDGDLLLLENGDYILLESASGPGATEDQLRDYAWIAPDSGYFADGNEAYKIV